MPESRQQQPFMLLEVVGMTVSQHTNSMLIERFAVLVDLCVNADLSVIGIKSPARDHEHRD
jgi:hypothetical protein